VALTKKRRKFVHEYCKDFNATQAAIRAGYSERSAYSQGQRLLKNDEVASEIQKALDESAMSAEECLKLLGEQARSNIADFVEVKGGLIFAKDLEALKEAGLSHLIKSIWNTKKGVRIELHDQQKALELIGKHQGLFKERVQLETERPLKLVLNSDGSVTKYDSE
jgi:phage terminase small subunit